MSAPHKVVIFLATLNGAKFLSEQLESYRRQTYSDWELLVSDDGSADSTLPLIEKFARSIPQRVTFRNGPRQGFWQNFVSLVRATDIDGGFFAYSDQDDIWVDSKLERAVAWLQTIPPDIPALYFTRTELIHTDGSPAGHSPLFMRPPNFRNALVQSIGGGNTMTFNRAARLALAAIPGDVAVVSHDWWTYQIISGAGGVVKYDPQPGLKYRQHEGNLVGSNIGPRARLSRMLAFVNGRFVMWNDINIAMLDKSRHLLSPANQQVLDRFISARQAGLLRRLYLLWKSGVYRQNALENLGLFLGAMFGRL